MMLSATFMMLAASLLVTVAATSAAAAVPACPFHQSTDLTTAGGDLCKGSGASAKPLCKKAATAASSLFVAAAHAEPGSEHRKRAPLLEAVSDSVTSAGTMRGGAANRGRGYVAAAPSGAYARARPFALLASCR